MALDHASLIDEICEGVSDGGRFKDGGERVGGG